MHRWLASLALLWTACAWAGNGDVLDSAERLALWGYMGDAWAAMAKELPASALADGTGLTPHQRAQRQYLVMCRDLAAFVQEWERVDFETFAEGDLARRTGEKGKPAPPDKALLSAEATAKASARRLQALAGALQGTERTRWQARALVDLAFIAVLREDVGTVRRLLGQALALPGLDALPERSAVEVRLSELAQKTGDPVRHERHLRDGIAFLERIGAQDTPYYALVWQSLALLLIDAKRGKEAVEAVRRYDTLQRSAPDGGRRARREFEVAQMLYRLDQDDEAANHLTDAIVRRLANGDEPRAGRVKGVRGMFMVGSVGGHGASRIAAGRLLLLEAVRTRFADVPEYRDLLDTYGAMAGKAGDLATMAGVAALRAPGRELGADSDERVVAALRVVETAEPGKLVAQLGERAGVPAVMSDHYFGDVFVLQTAQRRIRERAGVEALAMAEATDALVQLHRAVDRDDLAAAVLRSYRNELVDTGDAVPAELRETRLERIARTFEALRDRIAADETRSLRRRIELTRLEHACVTPVKPADRVRPCLRFAEALREARRPGQGVEVLLELHDQLAERSARVFLGGLDVSAVADGLQEALGETMLAGEPSRYIVSDGATRRASVGRICAALARTALVRPDGYCGVRRLRGVRGAGAIGVTFEAERARLHGLAIMPEFAAVLQIGTRAADPLAAIVRLRKAASDVAAPIEGRRIAALGAWETRRSLAPRNALTEADLLLSLAALYPGDDAGALVLELVDQAIGNAAADGGVSADLLRRGVSLAARADSDSARADIVMGRIERLHDSIAAWEADDVGLALALADSKPPVSALQAYERLLRRPGIVRILTGSDESLGQLTTLCGGLVRMGRDTGLAPRAYSLLQALRRQVGTTQLAPAARKRILLAAIELGNLAGGPDEVAGLVSELRAVRGKDDNAAGGRDPVAAWDAAMQAARGLQASRAAVHALDGDSPWERVLVVHRDAIGAAIDARDFAVAESLVDNLLQYSLRRDSAGLRAPFDSLMEVKLITSAPCSVIKGQLFAHDLVLPRWRRECAALMAAWHRDAALFSAYRVATAEQGDDREGLARAAATALEEYLGWQSARANAFGDRDQELARQSLAVVDLARGIPTRSVGTDRDRLVQRIAALTQATNTAVRDVQARLREDEAILVLHQATDALFGWTLTRQGLSSQVLPIGRAEARLAIRQARQQFYLPAGTAELPDVDVHALANLYQLLLRPFLEPLADVGQLYVVPNGPLAPIPFATLVTRPPRHRTWRPGSGWRPDWLVDRLGVNILRSAGDLRGPAGPSASHSADRFLGAGQPMPLAWDDAVRLGVPCLADLPPLDAAEAELRDGAAVFGTAADLRRQREFTSGELARLPWHRYRYVLLASHGVQADVRGCATESAVVTSPGAEPEVPLLTASAVAALRLDADLVILSACESGVDDFENETQPAGALASAFLNAGAHAVLAANWPLVSQHAGAVTTPVLREVHGERLDPARGLRQVMQRLAAQEGAEVAHPAIWGALFLVEGP